MKSKTGAYEIISITEFEYQFLLDALALSKGYAKEIDRLNNQNTQLREIIFNVLQYAERGAGNWLKTTKRLTPNEFRYYQTIYEEIDSGLKRIGRQDAPQKR